MRFPFFFLFAGITTLLGQIASPCDPSMITPATTFEETCINCGFNGYIGSTSGWTEGPVPLDFCGTDPAPQWIGFVATSNNMSFTITPSGCSGGKGIQAAIYRDFNEPAIVCNPGCDTCGNTPIVLVANDLVKWTNYYFLISGFEQDECGFILANPFPSIPMVGISQPIEGPGIVCPGGDAVFSFPIVDGAGYYTWESNHPSVLINGIAGAQVFAAPLGNSVNITTPAGLPNGTVIQICVTPMNSCSEGLKRCKNITLQNIPDTQLPKVTICNEDSLYVLPWGEVAATVGTTQSYSHTYSTAAGCDSTVRQNVQILYPITTSPTKYICKGSSVAVCGNLYSSSGQHVTKCTSYQGCDSTVTLTLYVLDPIARILAPDTLAVCGDASVVLLSQASPNSPGVSIKTWKNVTTGMSSPGESFLVTQPGKYILTTNMSAGGVQCSAADTVDVVFHPSALPLNAFVSVSNTLTCFAPTATLNGGAQGAATTFSWTGPQNFEADTSVVSVSVPGLYTFWAANEICNETVNITVFKNTQTGMLNISTSPVGCNQPASIKPNPTLQGLVYQWITPNGDSLFTQNIVGELTGLYTVIATNPENGCSIIDSVQLVSDTTLPVIQTVITNTITGQNTGSIDLYLTGGASPFIFTWLHDGNVIANTQNITNLEAGIYNVIVEGNNGCDTTLELEVMEETVSTVALPNQWHWTVSPNPATEIIHLQWTGSTPAPESDISCFDFTGRLLFKKYLQKGQTLYAIDCSSWPRGVYWLEMTTGRRGGFRVVVW